MNFGKLYGVGTGPGDPDLLTIKAVRALAEADVVAHFAKRGNASNARAIVVQHLKPDVEELPLLYPVTTEVARHDPAYDDQITAFYDQSARAVAERLEAGLTVAILSEGDPLFYGSYMHLHVRLSRRFQTEVIPGITAMSGSWSQASLPIVQGDDILSILPGTLDEDELARRIAATEAVVIMKVGRNLAKIRRALAKAGRLEAAIYVERATMANTTHLPLAEKAGDDAPYFAIVLVPGWSARIDIARAAE